MRPVKNWMSGLVASLIGEKKMDPFDPAINYGPNDAGISAITIILVVIAIIAGSWTIGKLYGSITDLFTKSKNSGK